MFINPNTEIPLCFTYIVDTTVTIAFVNHVGFVEVFVLQIEKGLNFSCQPNHLEDITVPVLLGTVIPIKKYTKDCDLVMSKACKECIDGIRTDGIVFLYFSGQRLASENIA